MTRDSTLRLPTLPVAALVLLLTAGTGCAPANTRPAFVAKSEHASNLNHVVLISLADPADAAACTADCWRRLAAIDAVETIWVGTPVDTGRAAVDGDYEVGLCVGFRDQEGLQAYLQDPRHLALVDTWKPRATRFRIFDVGTAPLDR
jgi:hypothetical protein